MGTTTEPNEIHLAATGQPLAVPVMARGRVLGLLYADAQRYDERRLADPSVLRAVASHFEAAHALLAGVETAPRRTHDADAKPLEFSFHARNSSVFLDGSYLIKGVAGALLWRMLSDYAARGRTDFCYRELRLDPALRLPDLGDNMGARLILLQQRLAQRCPAVRIERLARGLVRLAVDAPVMLA